MTRPPRPSVIVASPYLADANNGNWRTAARWARLLAPTCRATVLPSTAVATTHTRASVLIALHARRSRQAIDYWKRWRPDAALIVALTGTDLYKDLPQGNADARASLADADRLVVLQADAPNHVPIGFRTKVDVVFQSATPLRPWPGKHASHLHCVLVAHLREEKDPRTAFAAWRTLPASLPVTLTVIGAALDPELGREANALAATDTRVQWLGARPHPWTRQAIKRAHLLVCPSRMEGGANVIVEAITAGTPVLASRVSGNVGLLGDGYPGFFASGDARALADLVTHAQADRRWLAELVASCAGRASQFTPDSERAALRAVVDHAIDVAVARRATIAG